MMRLASNICRAQQMERQEDEMRHRQRQQVMRIIRATNDHDNNCAATVVGEQSKREEQQEEQTKTQPTNKTKQKQNARERVNLENHRFFMIFNDFHDFV